MPVRCFTCGNLIADKFEEYTNKVKEGENNAKVLDALGIKRYCCRRMFVTTVETSQQIVPFFEAIHRRNQEVAAELE